MNPFIVAEMSANHLGGLERALAIVDAAADSGADAVKLQTWTPDTMCIDHDYTLDSGSWKGRKLVDLYREAWLPWEWHKPIFDRAKERGIECFSAPFDRESVDFLETLNCPRYKIASFELTDIPLIRYVARKAKPIILSTGMAMGVEICDALSAAREGDRNPFRSTIWNDVTLLRCVSAYPSSAEDANLAAMQGLRWFDSRGDVKFGLSDHSPGVGVAVAAAAFGASIIEKHLTLSRADGGPDAGFSMEPAEFKQMVIECRRAAAAIGKIKYGPGPNESTALRRSIWICKDIEAGEVITEQHLCTARPALGLPPSMTGEIIGARINRNAKRGEPLKGEMLS